MKAALATLVDIDSSSHDKPGTDRVAEVVRDPEYAGFEVIGVDIERASSESRSYARTGDPLAPFSANSRKLALPPLNGVPVLVMKFSPVRRTA